MSVDDRRKAILDAVIPLLIERGASVTTAEMAEAAGIAEGTIFRAFPDKATLLYEAIKATMDPEPVAVALAAIDSVQDIEGQLVQAGSILLDRFQRVTALADVMRSMPNHSHGHRSEAHDFVKEANSATSAALARLLEGHSESLTVSPSTAAAAFRGLIFATANPFMPASERLALDEAVAVLLNGITKGT